MNAGRNSIANEIQRTYLDIGHARLTREEEKRRFGGGAKATVTVDSSMRRKR
jgi:hypothetical protein